jgi:hypothetical protein
MERVLAARRGIVCALVLGGCAAPQRVALESAVPVTQTPTVPLEVKTRSSGVRDPLPIEEANRRRWPPAFEFSGLEPSLGHAVATALVPWAEAHRFERPEGWQLLVELIEARAERAGPRILVTVGARATLRTRAGNQYLAQTQVHCRQAALVEPAASAPLFYACLNELGRELGGWLGGVQP